MKARNFRLIPLAGALLALLASMPALAASSYTKPASDKYPAIKSGGSLDLTNLVGHVDVVAATDGVLTVDSKITAVATSDADAQAMAGKIHMDVETHGNSVSIMTRYPLSEYSEYFYRSVNDEGFNIGFNSTTTTYDGERVRISTGSFGSGANLHVDYTVHVPKGVKVKVDNKVGLIEANGVEAPMELDSSSGDIKGGHNTGSLTADTGSGDVTLDTHDGALELNSGSGDINLTQQKGGDVKIRTGSGDVTLENLGGALTARTGSGDVRLTGFKGSGMDLETGSGDITVRDATGSMRFRAGSGDIRASDIKAGEAVECHTGSGGINVSGDLSAVLRLSAESGSGDIDIHTTNVPSLHIDATSDSGDVDVDLPEMKNVSVRHHSFRADVNGAKGTADLESGSGDVTFSRG
ncbi:MAG: DUF4097 family beta strand repeat-containing protein [Bacillota bacterium]